MEKIPQDSACVTWNVSFIAAQMQSIVVGLNVPWGNIAKDPYTATIGHTEVIDFLESQHLTD